MTQPELPFDGVAFSTELSEEARDEGMAMAAFHRLPLLEKVRHWLREFAKSRPDRIATADDARALLIKHGYQPSNLGNAAGSLFLGDEWELIGYTKSAVISRHANRIGQWRLK